jgi:hypothetical protein
LASANYLRILKYRRWQNIQKHWRIKNLGIDKLLASTKYWHQQNIGVGKTLAHEKLGVSKI